MSSAMPFTAITDARIEVIASDRRAAAFAKMARANGGPLLRPVVPAAGFCDDPGGNDVAMGLYAKLGCSGEDQLTGLLVMRERPAGILRSESPTRPRPAERLFLIEALTVSSSMSLWRPSVRAILVATAAMCVATVHHDPDVRTLVALRASEPDDFEDDTVAIIGGRRASMGAGDGGSSIVADVPDSELRFLDDAAASDAAGFLLAHIEGSEALSQPAAANLAGRSWDRQLSLAFPRILRHAAEEVALIARGTVKVAWSMPIVAINDADYLEVANVGRV